MKDLFLTPIMLAVFVFGLSVENVDEEKWAFVVWNKSIWCKSRDRVLFAIKSECCSLKCGYADYLERTFTSDWWKRTVCCDKII